MGHRHLRTFFSKETYISLKKQWTTHLFARSAVGHEENFLLLLIIRVPLHD